MIHNEKIGSLIKPRYTLEELVALQSLLESKGTLSLAPLPNGLFPARDVEPGVALGGYQHVWVRDNIYIAHALYVNGETNAAVKNVESLAGYFWQHRHRFTDIIANPAIALNEMRRPNIRFDGLELKELVEDWAHAQNDALGYFLWLFCRLARDGAVEEVSIEQTELLAIFVDYFQAIRFWEDEDSGHWEEARKISASSIGVVVGALRELDNLLARGKGLDASRGHRINVEAIKNLVDLGCQSLELILPAECIQPERERKADAALLFLIYPVAVVDDQMADKIIAEVTGELLGEIGIRRYAGDSYWCANYKELWGPEKRTSKFSGDALAQRDSFVKKGEEAQWCLFDPVLSSIYAKRYQATGRESYLEDQIAYLNRSLAQVTSDFRCPEAYYLEHGAYVANDDTPLHWTQANLWVALRHAQESLTFSAKSAAGKRVFDAPVGSF